MLPNQTIKTKWNCYTRQYYIDKGYNYTKINDEFYVDIKDLLHGSNCKVTVICDYCGKEFQKIYRSYWKGKSSLVQKDCCEDCWSKKNQEVMMIKYGVSHATKLDIFAQKQAQTNMERYGVKIYSKTQECKEKVKKTNLEKYGSENFTTSNKFIQDSIDKFGVTNPSKSPIVREKAMASYIKNGTIPKSKGEIEMCELLIDMYGKDNCFPSYQLRNFVMDCLLKINDIMIDVEFDGKYWHNKRKQYDRARDEILKKEGYKILRISSNKNSPNKEQIQEAINYLLSKNENKYSHISV